jgi:putative FmdB family regulatory protein
MPIYEYRCKSCESHFDVLQRVDEEKKDLRCPKCGHEKVEKQFSAFATTGGSSGFSAASRSSSSCGSGGFS